MSKYTDTSDSRTVGRRRILKGVGVVSFGGLASSTFSRASTPHLVEYPKLVSGDEVVEYIKVPADWDQHRKHAKEALNRIRGKLHFRSTVKGTMLVQSPQVYGGWNGLKIKVFVEDSGYGIRTATDDINITKERVPEVWGKPACSVNTGNCTNKESGQHVQGGEYVGRGNSGVYGTTTGRVTVNGNERLLHCGHVFWSGCGDANNVIGRRADVYGGNDIGIVRSVDVKGDFTTIEEASGGEFGRTIDDNRVYPELNGYVTAPTLESWNSGPIDKNGPCVYQMGTTTGVTSGRVAGTGANYTGPNCTNMRSEGVYTYCNAGQGDSGGPTFHIHNGDAYLINVMGYYYLTTHSDCNGNSIGADSAGTAAWWIRDNTNIRFNKGKTT